MRVNKIWIKTLKWNDKLNLFPVPISETRCHSRGGECFPKNYKCAEKLTFNEATDCDYDEKCCILVN